ncbi:hypothetical protein FOPG_19725 [Fusarium oxysporum f. sp. conglutinans race 2 54008]|uniref:Uncharacterized protein n=1 Tax=Fusarium oxysporum f. sp. conglutinans race 2 54008 TaxID=1089457 RepID=X0GW03_FUSOX|nr:hypothetical protein FOPG_19725 [Fusarium oxysporum f. sp. conglutinans race 2 54008]
MKFNLLLGLQMCFGTSMATIFCRGTAVPGGIN